MHRGLGAFALLLMLLAVASLGAGMLSLVLRTDGAAFYCFALCFVTLRAGASVAEAGRS